MRELLNNFILSLHTNSLLAVSSYHMGLNMLLRHAIYDIGVGEFLDWEGTLQDHSQRHKNIVALQLLGGQGECPPRNFVHCKKM